jgi:hypothetical protein
MSAARIVPIFAICGLGLAAAINWARGKDNQTFEGIAVQENLRYQFFPEATGCGPRGTSYLLLPNSRFQELVREEAVDHIEDLLHSTWKIKLKGNTSRIGRFGPEGRNLRELAVLYVIDARRLDCRADSAGSQSQP